MAEFIVMPKLGFDMQEAVLNNWLKEIGETISRGEVVAEIESDKATLELESHADGVLLHTLEAPGAIVPIGANLAIIGAEGEDYSNLLGSHGGDEIVVQGEVETAVTTPQQPIQPTKPTQSSDEFPGGIKATPVARRIAQEKGLDISQITGSGPDGRIRKIDVESFATQSTASAPAAVAQIAPIVSTADSEEIPMTKLRQAIGRRMAASKTTVPHFYVTSEIDMAEALTLRKQVNAALPDEQKVTVNDLIVKATALALREFPNLNAAFAGDKIIRHKRIHVGTAVAVEGGLLTVVQKNTDTSTLSKVAADNKAMIGRARNGRVKPDDVDGATFTVSNLGGFDVDHFIAIINPPDAAILAVGSAKKVPVVVDDELTIGVRMKATISADHRVTDGAEAAQFMQKLKALLENPLRLLL